MDGARVSQAQLDYAYASCRAVARGAAKNFYYAFLALPKEKRNALCAVYAFMRHADDISDDQKLAASERAEKLNEWLQQAMRSFAGGPTDDAVLLGLSDAQQRFKIPTELFEKLVLGTAMDVQETTAPGGPRTNIGYATFDDLYRYCYHVASVVGLVCIHIFGYRDAKAERLAERCGIAFQLTNILRDVKEDALMGRTYLPQEDMVRFGVSPQLFSAAELRNGFDAGKARPLLEFEALRAREFYRSGRELISLVDRESRPALWALVEIYSRLLEKIVSRDYDVFSERVRVSTAEKLSILARAWLRRLVA